MELNDIIGAKVIECVRQENIVALKFDNNLRVEFCVVGDDSLHIDMYKTRLVEEVTEHKCLNEA